MQDVLTSVNVAYIIRPTFNNTKEKMNPTDEQLFCISTAKVSAITKINAIAGAGKTSTLVLMSKEMTEPSLYLAFNKVTATEAEEKFPKHVKCRTTHSMAYAEFGNPLRDKLTRPTGGYVNVAGTGGEIAKFYKIKDLDVSSKFEYLIIKQAYIGLMVKLTVQNFEQSAEFELGTSHLPWSDLYDLEKSHGIKPSVLGRDILGWAKKLWSDRINVHSKALATHDTYLKLWQLSKPVLEYAIIYLDEAQDTTPCVLDIVMRQACKIILVGDNRQNIYGWRGAVNAMEIVQGATATLSKSFRYGQAVADAASTVLENTIEIEGRSDIPSVVGEGVVDQSKPYTVLCRTNSYLLDSAATDIEDGLIVSIEIDVKDFVKVLESAKALYEGREKDVKHERVLPFSTWGALVEEGEDGGEFKRISRIVEEHRADKMINLLQHYVKPKNPQIIYTTAHKSKGREFAQVILAPDFPSCYNNKGKWVGLNVPEQNLLYVAVTRAIFKLDINQTLFEMLGRYGNASKKAAEGATSHEEVVEAMLVCA